MLPLKPISGFLARAILVYALFIIPWPGVMDAYRSCFRGVGNALFAKVSGDYGQGMVRFEPYSSDDQRKDTQLVLEKHFPSTMRGRTEIQSILLGYRPTAFLIALIAATPIPWSRRWKALLWGLLTVNVFIALRVWIPILIGFGSANPLAVYEFSSTTRSLLAAFKLIFVQAPVMHYLAPTFMWLLITFRRGDFETILSPSPVTSKIDE